MGTTTTPINGFTLPDDNEPLKNAYAFLRQHASQLEAALRGRGLTSSDVTGYLDLLGLVNSHTAALAALAVDYRPLTLINGWLNYGAPYEPAYCGRIGRLVTVNFMLKGGATGTVAANLPVGFRPAGTIYPLGLAQAGATSGMGPVTVATNGDLTPFPSVAGYTNMSGAISFVAKVE